MTASIEDVATVVRNHDDNAPVAMDIEEKLIEVTSATSQQAYELVSDALDAGIIAETNPETGFGGIRLTEDNSQDTDTDNTTVEEKRRLGTVKSFTKGRIRIRIIRPSRTPKRPGRTPGEVRK